MNDFSELGDGTHRIVFNMLGLFSFRQLSIKDAIRFWWDYLDYLDLTPDYVTVHPYKTEWIKYHNPVSIKLDTECKWSDGEIGGYCTEFFKDGIEIGNIVNPLGDCIDVGFGAERLEQVLGWSTIEDKISLLQDSYDELIVSGVTIGGKKQGYVLRKIMTELLYSGVDPWDKESKDLFITLENRWSSFKKLKPKYPDKDSEWWLNTHGIDTRLKDIFEK